MMRKRGQAALEFLMTYGWAILVVLAAIGALAYFGVLSPDRFLPEKCTLPSGVACLDFRYDPTGTGAFELVVQNSQGFDVTNVILGLTSDTCGGASQDNQSDGNRTKYRITCASAPPAGKFKGTVTYYYVNGQTGLQHNKSGELIAKIP